jgi:hypothetical protein
MLEKEAKKLIREDQKIKKNSVNNNNIKNTVIVQK